MLVSKLHSLYIKQNDKINCNNGEKLAHPLLFACLHFDSEFLKIFDHSIELWTRASFVPVPLYEMLTAALQKRCALLVIGKRYVPQRVDHRNLKSVAQNIKTMLHLIAKQEQFVSRGQKPSL